MKRNTKIKTGTVLVLLIVIDQIVKNIIKAEIVNKSIQIIPNILKSTFDDAKTFEMYGDDYDTKDGTCVRDYINIEDLIDAHLLALEYLNNNGQTNYFNLGTKEGSTVKEVFDTCEEICNKEIPVSYKPRREGDPAILVADNTKAKRILGWEPKFSLIDSLTTAYKWERELNKRITQWKITE